MGIPIRCETLRKEKASSFVKKLFWTEPKQHFLIPTHDKRLISSLQVLLPIIEVKVEAHEKRRQMPDILRWLQKAKSERFPKLNRAIAWLENS